ncbi:hypothetical protein MIMGU_mgv1a020291mg [Erythranthe guttata]|uniref:Uncharacterized protein n=1 Tax=Erythranthe guttata TaxID=4155 RepID=A0A022QHM1_ERYGU|nr:PREDICTED: uncharacterized protein LOC105968249 [Erythranthe guttata]EYU28202.1 hypothetical protein MIMGU_mgv1a020291mg [Erythranthe guttata]|eukprot:XP_012848333.1 PREDICTED: uncharacterized protein LOC105968249 [Erythranthe guttata]
MSRCFPFPPPGYELTGAKIGAFIDSDKVSKRKNNGRTRREERRKRNGRITSREAEIQPLERSGLREEHSHPTSSSDSTNNSHKTKKHYTHSQGKVILIRLPSNEKNELHSVAKEQYLCSISAVGVENSAQTLELRYKNLLEGCLPSLTQYARMDTEDLDWLMQGKNEDVRTRKRQRFESGDCTSLSKRSELWPRTEYLHEIGIYALPFTVPY